jgi:hypothetical protein
MARLYRRRSVVVYLALVGVTVRVYRSGTPQELEAALDALLRDGIEGLVSFQGGLSLANRQLLRLL